MKIEEIFKEWEQDSNIDHTELGRESLKIPKLHHKYYQIYIKEKLLLRKFEADLKQLKLDKYEFYTQGPHKETPKDWQLPAIGKVLKNDVNTYMDADKEIIALSLKIGYQMEKIDLLDSIIKSIATRNFIIKNGIDWAKFQVGA